MIDEDLYCPQCGYNLRGIPENRCPECGFGYDRGAIRAQAISEACNRHAALRHVMGYAIFAATCALVYLVSRTRLNLTLGFVLALALIVFAILPRSTRIADPHLWVPESPFFYWLLLPLALFLWGLTGMAVIAAGVGLVMGWLTCLEDLKAMRLTSGNLSEELQRHLKRYRIASTVILCGATVLTPLCLI